MVDTEVPPGPVRLQPVPLQTVSPTALIPGSGAHPLALYQDGAQAAGVVGNAVVDNRVM